MSVESKRKEILEAENHTLQEQVASLRAEQVRLRSQLRQAESDSTGRLAEVESLRRRLQECQDRMESQAEVVHISTFSIITPACTHSIEHVISHRHAYQHTHTHIQFFMHTHIHT